MSGRLFAIPGATLFRNLKDNLTVRIAKSIPEFNYTFFIYYLHKIMKCQAPEIKTTNKIVEDIDPFFF